MKDILEEIVARQRIVVAEEQLQVPAAELERRVAERSSSATRSMSRSLRESSHGIIAEFKRRSPSKCWIKRHARANEIAGAYSEVGAAAISILTNVDYFGGALADIVDARPHTVGTPLLRKEFIIDEYQLLQAASVGADAVLLIAAALKSPKRCRELAAFARSLGLEVLLEIHSASELDHVNDHVNMVGVNNRNLGTFHTDVENSYELARRLPAEIVKVSESGISKPETVRELRQAGFNGFLIGECFMSTPNPAETLRQFIKEVTA
jgi:indole-3-glycerol phosphate synthase